MAGRPRPKLPPRPAPTPSPPCGESPQRAPHHLAAIVLGTSLFNVTGLSLAIGLSSALETLCAQAVGAGEHRALGGLLQRAIAVGAVVVAGVLAIWFGPLEGVLGALGQPAALASEAVLFIRLTAPALVLANANESIRRYLVAQGAVAVPAAAAAASAAASAAAALALVPSRGLGGAAAAYNAGNAVALAVLALGSALHETRVARPAGVGAWAGLSPRAAFSGWRPYLAVALPSCSQVCIEWWTFEALILMAGALPGAEAAALAVAATGVGFQTVTVAYSLPLGIANAASARVGAELGAGRPAAARRAAGVATGAASLAAAAAALALLAARRSWPRLFSADPAVIAATASIMPLVATALVGDGVNGALAGAVRGAGRQGAAAALNLVAYWAIGIPCTAWLAFKAGLGLTGLWAGLAATTALQAAAMAAFVFGAIRWPAEADAAAARVKAAAAVGREEEGAPKPRSLVVAG